MTFCSLEVLQQKQDQCLREELDSEFWDPEAKQGTQRSAQPGPEELEQETTGSHSCS